MQEYVNHFPELHRRLERNLIVAVEVGTELIQREIEKNETRVGTADPSRRIYPGKHLKDSFSSSPPLKLGSSIESSVSSDDVNARWQEKGTRRGVTALNFFQRGLESGFPALMVAIRKAVR